MLIFSSLLEQSLLLDYSLRYPDHNTFDRFSNYFTLGAEGEGSGFLGMVITYYLVSLFGYWGTFIITLSGVLIGFIVYTKISIYQYLKKWFDQLQKFIKEQWESQKVRSKNRRHLKEEKKKKAMEAKALAAKEGEEKASKKKQPSFKNPSEAVGISPEDQHETGEVETGEPGNPSEQKDPLEERDPSEQKVQKGLPPEAFSPEYYQSHGKNSGEASPGDRTVPGDGTSPGGNAQDPLPGQLSIDPKPPVNTGEKQGMEAFENIDFTSEEKPYQFPGTDLLTRRAKKERNSDRKHMHEKAKVLEDTLKNFGVSAKVVHFSKGPSITRYELQPETGVKVSKVVNLSDDIALNMAASAIRIEAPIPGKAAIGIEIPNEETSMVDLRELLESDAFRRGKEKIPFALGKNVSGAPIMGDISKMPHLLIAGATGSGKSVCINTLILSILYGAKPEEVKLILVDPKVVELNQYNGIPHLLIPVVTDPKKATTALSWAVDEMTKRYEQFAENGVKDIAGYNEKFPQDKLPYIVIIIDELADLMLVAPGEVEDKICRIAQMARAAGIHLIIATQRPSVNVITGVIKANIPSRIAFSVASQVDSRTIIDTGGAEKLLGKGDMLFQPIGANKPQRLQGSFVEENEVEKVVSFLKGKTDEEPEYQLSLLEEIEVEETPKEEPEDALYRDARELVIEREQASVSMLQRKFKIGYNRAARLIDALEEGGVVGPHEGSKPRRVMVSKEAEQLQEANQEEKAEDSPQEEQKKPE
ncbi:DNA translocase FtsK [Isachenkonia alkalipeptolytica]|uniref:DNA translocase FtsK n=2 Tax=Isachenkonia alkalipeptolytica TaxID=2565777 RepID=A0AA43XJV3_9CLOT|nr:DNA translocase FtsK [Isachenkonia alkalipeptolytica]